MERSSERVELSAERDKGDSAAEEREREREASRGLVRPQQRETHSDSSRGESERDMTRVRRRNDKE